MRTIQFILLLCTDIAPAVKYLIVEVEQYDLPAFESVKAGPDYLNNAAFVKEDYLLRKFAPKLFDYKFMSEKDLSYKEAYSRLEQIQRLIEDNQLDVDDLNERLKEVSVLLKICRDKLFLADGETKKILEEIK